jgi:hypothetical protein
MNVTTSFPSRYLIGAGISIFWSLAMADPQGLNIERLNFAKDVIAKFGASIPEEIQAAILQQKVIPGMPPYEASLAAGAYSFEVKPDPAKWPANADPNMVIAAQSRHPDDSQVWCIFDNDTQFPEGGKTRFKVTFVRGKATTIERMEGKPQ